MTIFNYRIESDPNSVVIAGFNIPDIANYIYERRDGKEELYVFLNHIRKSKEIQMVPVKKKGNTWEKEEQLVNVETLMPVVIGNPEDISRFMSIVNNNDAGGDSGKLSLFISNEGRATEPGNQPEVATV